MILAATVSAMVLMVDAFGTVGSFGTRRAVISMKRGRGSFASDFGDKASGTKKGGSGISSKGSNSMRGGSAGRSSAPSGSWAPVKGFKSVSDLPTEEGKVKLVDTMAPKLVDGATNPNGAVSVVKYESATYCFSASCASCKIPLSKAKVLPPSEETGSDPRLVCDFCSATYNLKNGARVESAGTAGLVGGLVKGLFSKANEDPIDVYPLGEKDGQVMINLQ